MGKLTDKVAKGVFWVLMEKFGIQAAHFVVTLVLARLLTPNDYGTVALLSVMIALGNVLVDCGLGRALVQKRDATQDDFNTVFYISIVLSLVLYAALFLSAPFVAEFYEIPELKPMLRVLSLSIFFHAMNGVQGAELARKMKFKLSFRISWATTLVSAITGIWMAFCGYGAWALVWSSVAGGVAGVAARQLVIRWRPTMTFSRDSARQMFSFGWKMLVGMLVRDLYANLYTLVAGKCFSRADLGFIRKGSHTAGFMMNTVDSTIARVSFPALAKMQDDPGRLRSAMRRMIRSSTFFVFPAMSVLAVVAEPLVVALFGEKWLPSAPFLRLACFSCAVRPFSTVNVQAIVARGHSNVFMALTIINRLIGIISMAISYRWGVYAFVASGTFSVGIGRLFVNSFPNWRYLGYSLRMQMLDVLPSLAMAGISAAAAFAAGMDFPRCSVMRIFCGIPAALAVYTALAICVRSEALADMLRAVRPALSKRLPVCDAVLSAVYRRVSR